MPQMNFDLEDGLDPVSFMLKHDDAERFIDFMQECQDAKELSESLRASLGESEDELEQAERHRAQLREALISATASLAAADLAYAKHARRHGTYGKAEIDPFFSTRVGDFERAIEQARAALANTEKTP